MTIRVKLYLNTTDHMINPFGLRVYLVDHGECLMLAIIFDPKDGVKTRLRNIGISLTGRQTSKTSFL